MAPTAMPSSASSTWATGISLDFSAMSTWASTKAVSGGKSAEHLSGGAITEVVGAATQCLAERCCPARARRALLATVRHGAGRPLPVRADAVVNATLAGSRAVFHTPTVFGTMRSVAIQAKASL